MTQLKYIYKSAKFSFWVQETMGNIGELFQIFRLVTSWLIWLDTDPGPHPRVANLETTETDCFSI